MASERDLGSDSDDITVTELSGRHLEYVQAKTIRYLSKSKNFSARLYHCHGQPAKLEINVGKPTGRPSAENETSNRILVKNLPTSYDEQHLQMFFEYEKGQGGGPVKSVTLNREERSAVIEFDRQNSVKNGLRKRPIKIMDNVLDIVVLETYLKETEKIGLLTVEGIQNQMSEDLKKLQLCEGTRTPKDPVVKILKNDVSEQMKQFAIDIAREALRKNKGLEAATYIIANFYNTYGGSRACILGSSYVFDMPNPSCLICFECDGIKFMIYKLMENDTV